MMVSVAEPRPKPSLLTLPPELRNYIYALAVVKDKPVIAHTCNKPVHHLTRGGKHRLKMKAIAYPKLSGISLACRQTYQEASAIFYSHNEFVYYEEFSWDSSFERWLKGMRKRHQDHMTPNLKRMTIEFTSYSPHPRAIHSEAEVEAKWNRDGQVEARFGGSLDMACICKLLKDLKNFNDTLTKSQQSPRNPVLEYLSESTQLRSKFNFLEDTIARCSKCGRLQSKPER